MRRCRLKKITMVHLPIAGPRACRTGTARWIAIQIMATYLKQRAAISKARAAKPVTRNCILRATIDSLRVSISSALKRRNGPQLSTIDMATVRLPRQAWALSEESGRATKFEPPVVSSGNLTPFGKGGRSVEFEILAAAKMTFLVKMVVNRSVDRNELL